MQQELEKNQSFLSEQIKLPTLQQQIKYLLSNKQKFKCIKNNQAIYICKEKDCQISGLLCGVDQCQCQKVHQNCNNMVLSKAFKSILNKKLNTTQNVKQSFKTVYDIINRFIDRLSQIRANLQKQQQYFGLMKEQLQFIDIIKANKIQCLNGKLMNKFGKPSSNVQGQIGLLGKQMIIKDFANSEKQFDKICEKLVKYLQKINFKNIQGLLGNSKIIQQRQDLYLLNNWLVEASGKPDTKIEVNLLFRASQYNFKAEQFRKKCYGIPNLLLICKTQYNKIIGGFTAKAWTGNGDYIKDDTGKTFLYSVSLKQKYQCTTPNCSIYARGGELGPDFGGGGDLLLGQNTNNSSSNFPIHYNLVINGQQKYPLFPNHKQVRKKFIGDEKDYFNYKDYQIYSVKGI